MATLSVWKFDTADGAEQAISILKEDLASRQEISLHDAASVSWPIGDKKPRTRQINDLTGPDALGGAFWGLLFGLIFFLPLLGAALGAATGALSGALNDVGIDDTFINRTRDQITPGTSALFLMSSDAVIDRVRHAFRDLPAPVLLSSNLGAEQESALLEVFTS